MGDFISGLKSLSGLRILSPEQSDFLYEASEAFNEASTALGASQDRIRELEAALGDLRRDVELRINHRQHVQAYLLGKIDAALAHSPRDAHND